MTNKQKRRPADGQTEETSSSGSLDRLYIAHQVHTLAHLVASRLAVPQAPRAYGGDARNPWFDASSMRSAAAAMTPRPLFYWYP